jgi:outer membrane protein assembly factor BamA
VARRLVVLLALAACGGATPARVHKPGEEYLAAIRIEGNTAIDSDDLIPGLALERTAVAQRSIDDYQVQLDTNRIVTAYEKLGYFQVDVKARVDKQGDAATLVFTVIEGPRAKVKVELIGLPPEVPADKARALVLLQDGAPFDYDTYDDAKLSLHRIVEDAGYAHVDIEASVLADKTHALATLRYVIDAGARCKFGTVTIVGADGMLADAVRARLKFAPGDVYSESATDDTQSALYAVGLFSSVRVDADRDTAATVINVKVSVARGDLNELRAGFGGGVDPLTYFVRGRLQYTRLAFGTPLTTLTGDLRPEYAFATDTCGIGLACTEFRGRALVRVTQQDLFLTDVKGDVEVGYEYLTLEAYTRTGPRAALGLTSPIGSRRLQLRLGWQYTYSLFTKVYIDPATAAMLGYGTNTPNSVGAYTGALVLDLRDKPIEPTRGIYAELRGAKGTPYAGGSFDYLEVTPEVRLFWTLLGTTAAARARLGRISGDVPASERFYGGGVSSHRGFSPRRLSPADPVTGLVIGGAELAETSFELRHGIGSPYGIDLGGVVFLDGGDVTANAGQIDLLHLHWAIGTGLRWLSPIGPIGIDIAYRLDRTGPGEPEAGTKFNFLLAVGEAF